MFLLYHAYVYLEFLILACTIYILAPGYTQEVFAETLDVGVEHYRKIESGVYGLQPEKMLILYEKYRIEPTYLVTGDTNHKVDIELFLANCSREERDAFIDRMLAYMRKLMTGR